MPTHNTLPLNTVLPSVKHLPIARTNSEKELLKKIPEAHATALLMMDQYERDYKNLDLENKNIKNKKNTKTSKHKPEKQALITQGKKLGEQLLNQHQKLLLLAKRKKAELQGLISPKSISQSNIDYLDSKFKASLAEINLAFAKHSNILDEDDMELDLKDNYACLLRSLQILNEVLDVKILDWLKVDERKLEKDLDSAENNESKAGIRAERIKEKIRRLRNNKNEKKDDRDACKNLIFANEDKIQKLEKETKKLDKKIRKKIHANNSKYKYAKKITQDIENLTEQFNKKTLEIDKLTQENLEEAREQIGFSREIKALVKKIKIKKDKLGSYQEEILYFQKLQDFVKLLLGDNFSRVHMIKSMIEDIIQPGTQELEIIEDLRARTHSSMEQVISATDAYEQQESRFWRLINGVKSELKDSINNAFVLKEEMA